MEKGWMPDNHVGAPETDTPPQPQTALEFLEDARDWHGMLPLSVERVSGYDSAKDNIIEYGYLKMTTPRSKDDEQVRKFMRNELQNIHDIIPRVDKDSRFADPYVGRNLDYAKRMLRGLDGIVNEVRNLSPDRPIIEVEYPMQRSNDFEDSFCVDAISGAVYGGSAFFSAEDAVDAETLALATAKAQLHILTARHDNSKNLAMRGVLSDRIQRIQKFLDSYSGHQDADV